MTTTPSPQADPAAARPRTLVLAGNPRPASRTLAAAVRVSRELTGREPSQVADLAAFGPRLLDPDDRSVAALVAAVSAADLVVVASPTYKGTYTGLLKLFLDRLPPGAIRGVAVPMMLGAGPSHAMAAELTLRPVLTELGATVPTRALYVLDTAYDDPSAYAAWLAAARPAVAAHLAPITLRETGATA